MAEGKTFPISGKDKKENKVASRKLTDGGCCFCFIFVVGGMFALTVLGLFEGNKWRLLHPQTLLEGRDYNGRLCGVDIPDRPYLYFCKYPDPEGHEDEYGFPKTLNKKSKSCVASCPTDKTELVPCLLPAVVNITDLPESTELNVHFINTLNVEVTQSVANQRSYPTQQFLSKYCVPERKKNEALYDEVVEGPLKQHTQLNGAMESFLNGWWVLLGTALLATLLGVGYLHLLKECAGIVMFITLWVGTIMSFLFSVYFLIGIFFDPAHEDGMYQQSSPIFYMCSGMQSRVLSALVGILFLIFTMSMLCQAWYQNIDESIGVVNAALDCILGEGSEFTFVIQPLIQSIVIAAFILLLCIGFFLIETVERTDRDLMIMNGHVVPTEAYAKKLEAKVVRDAVWIWARNLYIAGSIWIIVTFVACCHFVISYAVCTWFFVEVVRKPNPAYKDLTDAVGKAADNKGKRVEGVRVAGVDRVHGPRSGYIERGPQGKVLVVPIGEKGPGGRDFIRIDKEITVKSLGYATIPDAVGALLFYHLGTMALASIVNLVTSPFRAISEMLKGFMGNPSRADIQGAFDDDDQPIIMQGMGLCTVFLDELFGRYSKNMYVDIVLRSSDFSQAANDAYDFIADAGGAVALLHGSTAPFEIVGVAVITGLCTMLTYVAVVAIPLFGKPDSEYYVETPAVLTVLGGLLSFIISSLFMSVFHMAADSLLYVFAWARQEHGSTHKYCPSTMQHLLGRELEEKPALALEANARGRMARFTHVAAKYKDRVMASMQERGTAVAASEERERLLAGGLSTSGAASSSWR